MLLLIPQRYEFSSKSQRFKSNMVLPCCCCWYHKGTNFQANHNMICSYTLHLYVVADTTKVRIFKQITTSPQYISQSRWLLLIPQRYEFSSKSQHNSTKFKPSRRYCWYHLLYWYWFHIQNFAWHQIKHGIYCDRSYYLLSPKFHFRFHGRLLVEQTPTFLLFLYYNYCSHKVERR